MNELFTTPDNFLSPLDKISSIKKMRNYYKISKINVYFILKLPI